MKFPKPLMRKGELIKLGFTEYQLDTAYRARGQRFAHKLNPSRRNSPIVFDTEKFGKYLENLARREDEARRMHL